MDDTQMRLHMVEAVDRVDAHSRDLLATVDGRAGVPFAESLLRLRDVGRDLDAWAGGVDTEGPRATELLLQFRILMASLEIHVARTLAHWPDDPIGSPDARKLGQIVRLVTVGFRRILAEHAA